MTLSRKFAEWWRSQDNNATWPISRHMRTPASILSVWWIIREKFRRCKKRQKISCFSCKCHPPETLSFLSPSQLSSSWNNMGSTWVKCSLFKDRIRKALLIKSMSNDICRVFNSVDQIIGYFISFKCSKFIGIYLFVAFH